MISELFELPSLPQILSQHDHPEAEDELNLNLDILNIDSAYVSTPEFQKNATVNRLFLSSIIIFAVSRQILIISLTLLKTVEQNSMSFYLLKLGFHLIQLIFSRYPLILGSIPIGPIKKGVGYPFLSIKTISHTKFPNFHLLIILWK